MECPFCHEEMKLGYIYGVSGRSVFWLPSTIRPKDLGALLATPKPIKEAGGIVLDKTTKLAFLSSKKPGSYYCKACHMLITKLEQEDNGTDH